MPTWRSPTWRSVGDADGSSTSIQDVQDHLDTVLQRCSPSAPLSAFITSYWLYQSGPLPHACERMLPTGIAQLVIDLRAMREWNHTEQRMPSCMAPTQCRSSWERIARCGDSA